MTSSLVGSEMCIRDRSAARANVAASTWSSVDSCHEGERGGAGPREREPVSYTHLTLPTICSV
eukprot:12666342-Prorocentrum_lima.AAC.1